jgi:lysophospholipase L1-like esterase
MNCKPLYLLSMLLILSAFNFPEKDKLTIWLIGDSTISIKERKHYPETGWGMPFVNFFDSTVVVDNRAKNGRSTRTFLQEGLWKPVQESLKAGDYVLIQFGHNDEVSTKDSYTTASAFVANLKLYIHDCRAKGAIPVLLTPVARRNFDVTGKILGTHDVYAELVRKTAAEEKTPLIDLDKESQAMLQQFGVIGSKYLFNHLAPGEHPNYPEGKEDNTHFNEFGARKMAELVLDGIRKQHLELENRIIKK